MNIASYGVAIFLLATLTEGFTEYLFSDVAKAKPYLKYIALAMGVGVSLAYRVDILAGLGLTTSVPYVGSIISGLIIGRGSNYVNDIVTSFQKPATPSA